MQMNKPLRHLVVLTLSLLAPLAGYAQQPQPQQFAAVEQLKSEAFKALKGGEFDRTTALLNEAATVSKDPALIQMSESIGKFQSERHEFASERQKGLEKAITDVKTLLGKDYFDAAVDRLKDANLLASDKDAFQKQDWVADLLVKAKAQANDYETHENWIKAQRMYSDLVAIEPANALWKDKFKGVSNRLRLLAMYTPDDFKASLEEEVKHREAAEQLINPTTQPATKPSSEENDSFKTDWHDMLRGVRLDMLLDALDDARSNYWREVSYKQLTLCGLKGLEMLASTNGIEKAFPSLKDQARRSAFLDAVHQAQDAINRASLMEEPRAMRSALASVRRVNDTSLQVPDAVIVNEFADGAFAELDPFSTMIWPADWDEFNKQVQGEFSGVGIQIQLDDDGNLKVVTPLEDSPADRKGIQADDVIVKIDGKNARGISINQAVKHITGPSGTTVTLTVKSPNGQVKDYAIQRETIHVASVKGYRQLPGGGWDYFVDPAQKIGYMRLTNFTKSTTEEMEHAIDIMQRQGAQAIVLDLRNNPGGLLTAATEVCDKFLTGGTIVSTRGERQMPEQPPMLASATSDDVKLPVVVLVNQFSASASEIVSGALQDQKRALVVGERTFGKGSVQMLFPLADHTAALKLTTSHYYLPSGRCIHKEDNSVTWGVDPDLTVEMTTEQMRGAQEARVAMEVLRKQGAEAAPTTQPKKDMLSTDPQLSAAVLLLKLQIAGATM
jgi:carboxyl-terminal processing protease